MRFRARGIVALAGNLAGIWAPDATVDPMKMSSRAKFSALAAAALVAASVTTAQGHGPQKLLDAAISAPTTSSTPSPTTTTPVATPPPILTPTRLTALPPALISDATAPLKIRLSGIPTPSSPPPTLRPAVSGTWTTSADYELFTPTSTLEPCSTYKLTIWANTTATGSSPLGKARTLTLQVACPSISALQQALARLGYLGARFHSSYGVHISTGRQTRQLAARRAYHPTRGNLYPSPSNAPSLQTGQMDVTTRGGLTIFQQNHGITAGEAPERRTWAALLAAETLDHHNPRPYTWVSVSESIPETLQVHQGDHVALSSPTNTGVSGAETARGTFPIYSRFTSTTMTGTNPDGTHYSDPGVPWVNYFNGGDAVHGFPRGSYGTPQSNGCVELPIGTAEHVFHMLAIGDLVKVTG
jgi:L,D-transpeptidase catalytic domain